MASYIEDGSILVQPSMLQRKDAIPLDRSSMFSSYTDAVEYAKGLYKADGDRRPTAHDSRKLAATAYIGQILTVYENDNVSVYKIDFDRTLKIIGGTDIFDCGTYGEDF